MAGTNRSVRLRRLCNIVFDKEPPASNTTAMWHRLRSLVTHAKTLAEMIVGVMLQMPVVTGLNSTRARTLGHRN